MSSTVHRVIYDAQCELWSLKLALVVSPCLTRVSYRYDVRLLLDSLPDYEAEASHGRPLSPSGWSDLPSDSEDTFFFSPDELEDYHREKRRRLIDRGREERLKAIAAAEGDVEEEDLDPWGGNDEEVRRQFYEPCVNFSLCHLQAR